MRVFCDLDRALGLSGRGSRRGPSSTGRGVRPAVAGGVGMGDMPPLRKSGRDEQLMRASCAVQVSSDGRWAAEEARGSLAGGLAGVGWISSAGTLVRCLGETGDSGPSGSRATDCVLDFFGREEPVVATVLLRASFCVCVCEASDMVSWDMRGLRAWAMANGPA